ncbi:DUF1073 domain-containing protein [Snodgrassella alvi]|uniref:DUF1073 domain-containing protein n=1 Tax=Snodgrassella alvi TaxID=1196083 RepID=UPI00351A3962
MMKFWKRNEIKARELEALEEANRLKKAEIDAACRRNQLSDRMMTLIYEMQAKSGVQTTGYQLADIPAGVVPAGRRPAIAQDSNLISSVYDPSMPHFYPSFIGYPALANMSQSTDYRCVYEATAQEMTRTWGEVKVANDGDDKTYDDKLRRIEARMKDLNVRDLMRRHIENEMIFGRSQLFIKIKGHESKKDIPLLMNSVALGKGCLKELVLVEPIWTTPSFYNANDATAPDFFKPSKWFVMGEEVHNDRLLTLVMRPVPDMLKPAYNFGGISMLQLMQPYVERWQRTVDSVSDLIHSFSLTGIKTDMSNTLAGGEDGVTQLLLRSKLFAQLRGNQNLMLLDKDAEEFFQFNTPLSTLDNLLQKAQEQMAAPSRTPLVKLLGITPSGLNASSDGEIQVYHEYISGMQESYLLPQLTTVLKLIQLDLFGEIDPQIVFTFNPLEQLNDEQMANTDKVKAERDSAFINAGVLSQEEVRARLAKDEDGDYSGIDAEDVPEPPEWGLSNGDNQKEAGYAASNLA